MKVNGTDYVFTINQAGAPKEYTFVLNLNGGNYGGRTSSIEMSPNLAYGTTNWRSIGVPSRAGFTFNGWFTAASGGVMVWDANGRAVKGDYWTDSYANAGTWNYDAPGGFAAYAQWTPTSTPKEYTFTVNPNGGNYGGKTSATVMSPNLTYGTTGWRSIGVPSRPGFAFNGWFTAPSGGVMVWDANGRAVKGDYWTDSYANRGTWKYDAPSGSFTAYAQWTSNLQEYTLTISPNGGNYGGKTSSIVMSPNLMYGTTSWRSIGVPSRPGCTFAGWFTAPSGGVMVWDVNGYAVKGDYWTDSYANRGTWKYDGNITVYAHWE